MTLREVLEAAAVVVADCVRTEEDDGATGWSVRGVTFATLSANGLRASFSLDPIVAGAAARTPDVTRSERGLGWVELQPQVVDGHAADRATAWFLSGHRRLDDAGV